MARSRNPLSPAPILLLSSFMSLSLAAATCYLQTGSPLSSSYQPCNSTTNTGACCNIGGGDICTSSGLCLRQLDIPGFIYQDGCTDSNWGSTCPSFCPTKNNDAWALQQCSDSPKPGTWCCRQPGAADCCAKGVMTTNIGELMLSTATKVTTKTVTAASNIVTTTATITVSSTSTSQAVPAAAGIGSSTTTSCAGLPSASSCPKDNTVPVGAGIGASLGVAFLASLGLLFWREKTRPKPFEAKADGMYYPPKSQIQSPGGMSFSPEGQRLNSGGVYFSPGAISGEYGQGQGRHPDGTFFAPTKEPQQQSHVQPLVQEVLVPAQQYIPDRQLTPERQVIDQNKYMGALSGYYRPTPGMRQPYHVHEMGTESHTSSPAEVPS